MTMQKIFFLFLFLPVFTFGQSFSDDIESEVKTFVTDSSSNRYWKKIYAVHEKSEKEYTKDELRLFYFSQGLKNVNLTPFPSLILDPDRLKMKQAANSNRCKKVLKIAPQLIEKNPFDLTTLVYYSMCVDKKTADTDNIYYSRMKKIVESILETGDGTSPSTAIKIANIGDDEILVGFLGFTGNKIGEPTIDGDIYSVWEDSQGTKLYFDYVFIFL
ncbi:MAG: hypothetical protein ACI9CP_001749 [Cryomorphaceae bacterium]|jgi:hypothetical protein